MKKILVVILLALAYLFGKYGSAGFSLPSGTNDKSRKIVYYVDPMHPWYKSDKPGIAPDCNMKLVPVYEGEQAQYEKRQPAGMTPGTVQITAEKQQLIGVEYGTAEYRTSVETI